MSADTNFDTTPAPDRAPFEAWAKSLGLAYERNDLAALPTWAAWQAGRRDTLANAAQLSWAGYVLVPEEPTEEMIAAAQGGAILAGGMSRLFRQGLLGNWRAMIAAAPKAAPAEQPGAAYAEPYGWDCAGALVRTRNTMESYRADGVVPVPLFADATAPKAAPAVAQEPRAWRDYAEHLEYCRTCAEDGIGACGVGARLKVSAMSATTTQAAPQPAAQGGALTQAARDVLAERQRQIDVEGWTPEHDGEHDKGQLAYAAASYAIEAAHLADGMQASPTRSPPFAWPWDAAWWKPSDTPRRNLLKSGALILAELERLDRAAKEGGTA